MKGDVDLNHANNYVSTRPIVYMFPPPPPTHSTLVVVIVTEHFARDGLPPYSALMRAGEGGRDGQAGPVLG